MSFLLGSFIKNNTRKCISYNRNIPSNIFSKNCLKIPMFPKCNIYFNLGKNFCSESSDLTKFNAVLPLITNTLVNTGMNACINVPEITERYKTILDYNLRGGKKIRAMILLSTFRKLNSNKEKIDDAEILRIYILGWCIEMFHAFELIIDDILDNSELRRGKPSWYFKNNQDLLAVYDGLLLYESVFILLKTYFPNESNYILIIKLFHDMAYRTNVAQILDIIAAKKPKDSKKKVFTEEMYYTIAINKTAYYSLYLPVTLALHMTSKFKLENDENVKDTTLKIGYLLQVQDDYLDCYGDIDVIGKSGTDIMEGKCTWLFVNALKYCNEYQKKILEENYGYNDSEKIVTIKKLYQNLDLESKFKTYETESVAVIKNQINNIPDSDIQNIFLNILSSIYKREK